MDPLIKKVNDDFRKILEEYDTPEHPAKTILQDVNRQFIESGCVLFPDKPFPIFLKPVFIAKWHIMEVEYATNVMMGVLEKATQLYFDRPDLKDYFQLKPEDEILCEIDHRYNRYIPITRNDAFMGPGYFKFIEFNTDSPGGPMYSDMQLDIISSTPIMEKLKEKYEFSALKFIPQVEETLLACYRQAGGKKEKPFIAIMSEYGMSTHPEFLLIVEWFKKKGYGSEFVDVREATYDGKHLRSPSGNIIDIMYRRGWLPNLTNNMDKIKPLIQAYKDGAVVMVNSPRSIIASTKSIMELLQWEELQKIFTEEERRVIYKYVPWTRLVYERKTDYMGKEVDLYPFIRKYREHLVLKPIDMYGGKDVCVGRDATESKWDEWLEKTTKAKYVVQEYVPIPEELFPVVDPELTWQPKKVNVNFFAYNGHYAGGMTRTSEASIINISAGGGLAMILVVEGEKK